MRSGVRAVLRILVSRGVVLGGALVRDCVMDNCIVVVYCFAFGIIVFVLGGALCFGWY